MPIPTWARRQTRARPRRGQHSRATTHEEAPGGQHVEHADRVAVVVRAGGQGREDDEDGRRGQQRVGPRPLVRREAEEQLADHLDRARSTSATGPGPATPSAPPPRDRTYRAGEGDVRDIMVGVGVLVGASVLGREHGVDGADDLFCARSSVRSGQAAFSEGGPGSTQGGGRKRKGGAGCSRC